MKLLPLLLSVIILVLGWLLWDSKTSSSTEKRVLEAEAKGLRERLDSANLIIKASRQREIALKQRYSLLDSTSKLAIQSATKQLKRLQWQAKQRTPILKTDSAYYRILDSLYARP